MSQVCVEQCPTEEFYAPNHYKVGGLASLRPGPICLPNVTAHTGAALEKAVQANLCAKWYMKSVARELSTNDDCIFN